MKRTIVKNDKGFPKGHICSCGEFTEWPAYVFAHTHVELVYTCDCGDKTLIYNLEATGETK